MARVTVEDCLKNIDNRFELVLVSSKRARQLALGERNSELELDNDKPTVVALREIAEGTVTRSILDEEDKDEEDKPVSMPPPPTPTIEHY